MFLRPNFLYYCLISFNYIRVLEQLRKWGYNLFVYLHVREMRLQPLCLPPCSGNEVTTSLFTSMFVKWGYNLCLPPCSGNEVTTSLLTSMLGKWGYNLLVYLHVREMRLQPLCFPPCSGTGAKIQVPSRLCQRFAPIWNGPLMIDIRRNSCLNQYSKLLDPMFAVGRNYWSKFLTLV